jgi:hypothetical protein
MFSCKPVTGFAGVGPKPVTPERNDLREEALSMIKKAADGDSYKPPYHWSSVKPGCKHGSRFRAHATGDVFT